MFFFFNQKYCSRTQVASSSPSPLPLPQREGSDMRDTPCGSQIFPLIITWLLKQTVLLKRTVSYTPLSAGEGLEGEAFFLCKREDVKSSFTSSLFTYILFLVPLLSTPHYVHIHKDIVVSAPPLRGEEELKRASWATFYITVLHKLDEYYTWNT